MCWWDRYDMGQREQQPRAVSSEVSTATGSGGDVMVAAAAADRRQSGRQSEQERNGATRAVLL